VPNNKTYHNSGVSGRGRSLVDSQSTHHQIQLLLYAYLLYKTKRIVVSSIRIVFFHPVTFCFSVKIENHEIEIRSTIARYKCTRLPAPIFFRAVRTGSDRISIGFRFRFSILTRFATNKGICVVGVGVCIDAATAATGLIPVRFVQIR
jgi:hypothetical protein